jgi:hypothetical protein
MPCQTKSCLRKKRCQTATESYSTLSAAYRQKSTNSIDNPFILDLFLGHNMKLMFKNCQENSHALNLVCPRCRGRELYQRSITLKISKEGEERWELCRVEECGRFIKSHHPNIEKLPERTILLEYECETCHTCDDLLEHKSQGQKSSPTPPFLTLQISQTEDQSTLEWVTQPEVSEPPQHNFFESTILWLTSIGVTGKIEIVSVPHHKEDTSVFIGFYQGLLIRVFPYDYPIELHAGKIGAQILEPFLKTKDPYYLDDYPLHQRARREMLENFELIQTNLHLHLAKDGKKFEK